MEDCLPVVPTVPSLTGVYLICVSAESQFSLRLTVWTESLLFGNKIKDRGMARSLDKHPNQMKNLINNNSNSSNCRWLLQL